MPKRKWSRTQQMWVIIVLCITIFGASIAAIPEVSWRIYWKVMLAAAVACGLCIILFEVWLRRVLGRRDMAITFLDRITSGDLSLSAREIVDATRSERMAASLRALVSNLERTIRRFAQLAADVVAASQQISGRSRVLARSAAEQLVSTDATSASVTQIDRSISNVRTSMEDLSANAEETSASILEMSASIEEVSRISDTLAAFVDETASAIEEMIVSINEVATNTESFSSFAIETASSMVEMNATTEEIGKSAKQSSELANSVKQAAGEGRQAVSGTVEGMGRIETAMSEAKSALNELALRSEEIGEIVRVIDEIAGQTNLLALNAAIIAAQAGDRGKAFGVVADEIRDLSERTSVSTDEIRTLIDNVQRSVERAAEQMSLSAQRVTEGVRLTARAEQVLQKILELTERSTSSMSEIARATDEQARGSATATAAIEQVTKMVQQTAAATQQQSLTSRKVGEQASTVRDTTLHLKRATTEQESGSRAIGRAMQNIMALVQRVHESIAVLGTESAAIVQAMRTIQEATRESNVSIADLNQMSSSLTHESALLNQELGRFTLPHPNDGGSITTATILWQQLNLDPVHVTAAALGYMSRAIHSTLVSYGEGAELTPGLAERWEMLEQGHCYRLRLRRGVRFHNGRLFEARDVHDSFVRLLSPELQSPSSWILRDVRGAEDVISGKAKQLSGITIRDPYTIDITLNEPLAFFLSLLSMNETSIVPADEARDRDRFRTRAIGTGPFRVEEAVEGQRIRLSRNRDYYIPGQPHIEDLTFRLDLRSGRDVAEAFARGELDIAHGIPPKIASEWQRNPRYAPFMLNTTQLHTSYFAYDCSVAPFSRVEVRRAINYAIDRERINERIFGGLGVVAHSLLPPGLLGYEPGLRGFEHDVERARALMRDGGYPTGFRVEYRTWDTDEFNNSGLLPLMIENLAVIGIEVNVTLHSATEARRPLQQPGHGMVFCGNWYADFPDPDNFFYVFFHNDSSAVRGAYFHSSEIDAQIVEGRRAADIERRREIYRSLNEMVV
ncbi:MAG: ABC transporter substrate-binding protein, partial [Acidobacteriota bacterium]|nr:ABC transporter substrate-binding protein [Acidobacteriota bacterium]